MKERPILFSGPMVRAILDGRKTQTRRVVKPQPDPNESAWYQPGPGIFSMCPYGQSGDRLWVRETWLHGTCPNGHGIAAYIESGLSGDADYRLHPAADETEVNWAHKWRRRPSIHMPRWASRINLEITDVCVERVQDISEADACHEGAPAIVGRNIGPVTYREGFRELWDSIYSKRGCGWDANPWCWCISFKVV
jgi:hypothetical protein